MGKIVLLFVVFSSALLLLKLPNSLGLTDSQADFFVEMLGAAVVASITWALVHEPERRRHAFELTRNHNILRSFWVHGPRNFVEIGGEEGPYVGLRFLTLKQQDFQNHLRRQKSQEALTRYTDELAKLIEIARTLRDPAQDRRWGAWYYEPWNDAHAAFVELIGTLSLWARWRLNLNKKYYIMSQRTEVYVGPPPKFTTELSNSD